MSRSSRIAGAAGASCMLIAAVATLAAQAPKAPVDPALFQGMQWRNIGPFRGGRADAVAGVPSDTLTYYQGTVGGGVWKSSDGGETWTPIGGDTFKTSSVGAIAVADSDPNVVYVGMGEHSVRGVMTSHGDGVYRSTDAGKSWTHAGLPDSRAISRICIHPTNPDLVYVAVQGAPYGASADRGVYRSADAGRTWDKVLYVSEHAGASDLAMDPANPRILYAAMWDHQRFPWQVRSGGPGSGIHKSTDGGTTWQKLTSGFPETIGKTAVAVAPNGSRVYALVEADPKGGLYRSDDGGATFTLVNEDWALKTRAWYYIEVYADPQNPDVVWVLNAGTHKSIDGGRTFTPVRTPHGDNHDLWINPRDPRVLINANDGGANVSFNGGRTWTTQMNQPTAQFYRVNTDNRFPYYVYGGQQDNSTVAIASRGPGGIDVTEWHDVGGCESAFVAFNPDDPSLVYAGCYMGIISEWNARTRTARDVMAYPQMPAAIPPKDLKYRFNWNAPIVVSQHDPSVIYHAANLVLRSTNRGIAWTEISPDLTRNDKDKQGPGGAPITNEGAGGETYNTITYLAESPHDRNVLWTGSDDGLVHVTRDGGKNWANVTPKETGEALVHAIEVSPHDPATAYIAVSRYKFNDFTPHLFKTTDYGKTWRRLVEGIAKDAWVRVVREDPARKDLLYAGTESGVFVSWDGGRRWQSLQLNLPVTPVNDLKVQGTDLVAATGGRAFWILDDLSPLRQADAKIAGSALHLFAPSPVHRADGFGGGFFGAGPRAGTNPPNGAVIDVYVSKVPEKGLELDILDAQGTVLRHYSSAPADAAGGRPSGQADQGGPGPSGPRPLTVKPGMNRFVWDLRRDAVKGVPGLFIFGSLNGPRIVPGTYTVRVSAGGTTQTQPIEVKPDPRSQATAADFGAEHEFAMQVARELTAIHEGVIRLRAVRSQIEDLLRRVESAGGNEPIATAGKALVEKLNAMEDTLVQKRTVDGQTVINFPMKLHQHFIYLLNAVDGSEGVTGGMRIRFADLMKEWTTHKGALDRLLGAEVDAFNAQVRAANVGPVVVPVP